MRQPSGDELQRDTRSEDGITLADIPHILEAEQARAIAVQHRAGRDHFGIEPRPARERPVERPAVPVGPIHHRGDGEAPAR